MRESARVDIGAQPFEDQAADFAAHAHALILELHTVAKCQSLGYDVVEDQIKGSFLEEIRADVEVSCILRALNKCLPCEAMGWYVSVCGGEDGGFDWRVRRWRIVFVGVVQGALWAEEDWAEGCRRAEKSSSELHWRRHGGSGMELLGSIR